MKNDSWQVELSRVIDSFLNGEKRPKHYGFALLVFSFNELERGKMQWVSSAQRADMIAALKEMVAQLEGRVGEGSETRQ